jgi:hypothetical protein
LPRHRLFAQWRCAAGEGGDTTHTKSEFDELRKADELPDWDYHPLDGDGECPFEYKWCDWGRVEGKVIAVDYSAPALADPAVLDESWQRFQRSLDEGRSQ